MHTFMNRMSNKAATSMQTDKAMIVRSPLSLGNGAYRPFDDLSAERVFARASRENLFRRSLIQN